MLLHLGQLLPENPPNRAEPPTMADSAVQQARTDTQSRVASEAGLADTQLTTRLGNTGQGNKPAGTS